MGIKDLLQRWLVSKTGEKTKEKTASLERLENRTGEKTAKKDYFSKSSEKV